MGGGDAATDDSNHGDDHGDNDHDDDDDVDGDGDGDGDGSMHQSSTQGKPAPNGPAANVTPGSQLNKSASFGKLWLYQKAVPGSPNPLIISPLVSQVFVRREISHPRVILSQCT